MTLVSILMPVFDSPGTYLEDAIRSVLYNSSSDMPSVELVIQDNNSSRPDTRAVLDSYRDDPRVSIESVADRGQGHALQLALDRATGDVVGWLNADDFYYEGVIAEAVSRLMQPDDIDAVFGDFTLVRADGSVIRHHEIQRWDRELVFRKGTYLFSGSIFYKTSVLRDVGFDDRLHYCMDFDILLRLPQELKTQRMKISPVAALRLHDESKTGSLGRRFAPEALLVRRRFAKTRREQMIMYRSYLLGQVVVSTQRIRHSRVYSRLRGTKRS